MQPPFTPLASLCQSWLPLVLACGLDRLVGDPRGLLHPVQIMGWMIARLRRLVEQLAGDRTAALRLAGGAITLLLVGGSALAGWGLERLARAGAAWGGWTAAAALSALVIALASALASRSLEQAVLDVLALLPAPQTGTSLEAARGALAWIVGRDTDRLDRDGILRALAETASENGVDGLFAPLFWMLVGAALWQAGGWGGPGPLALAWAFKAASTLDSMLGYRRGRLQWLGTAGARLDDLLVWLPCRLVAFSLPLAAGQGPLASWRLGRMALRDGRLDPSPNAGVSQAAYAWVVGVQLGGLNHYGGQPRAKPLLAEGQPPADPRSVMRMLQLNRRLEALWLGAALALLLGLGWLQPAGLGP